jgi:hypothetical protein
MILDSVPFKTERDSYDFMIRQLEGRGRKLTPRRRPGFWAVVTAQEFNTRAALCEDHADVRLVRPPVPTRRATLRGVDARRVREGVRQVHGRHARRAVVDDPRAAA